MNERQATGTACAVKAAPLQARRNQRKRSGALFNASLTYDPSRPILPAANPRPIDHRDKRTRASLILASIRTLSMECGIEGITVRDIARHSGFSTQTLYNLLGSRDSAIEESVKEYYRFVSLLEPIDAAAPDAVFCLIDRWIDSIEDAPQFQKHIGRSFLQGDRDLFYRLRLDTSDQLTKLFTNQRKARVLKSDVDEIRLSRQLVWYSGSLILDWCDELIDLDDVRKQLVEAFATMMAGTYESA